MRLRRLLREPRYGEGHWYPAIQLNGTWTMAEMLSTEELAHLYILQNQLKDRELNNRRAMRAPAR